MGRKVQSWRRAVPAMDVDDVHYVLILVSMASRNCVSGSAACALEGWNLEVCTSLCPWRFILGRILLQVLSRQARQVSLPCTLLESGTEWACSCPSPKGWYRANWARRLDLSRAFLVGPCGCYSVDLVAWGVGSNRGGGLCLAWMRLMCGVSMFPSVRFAAVVSPGRLLMRWRVGIVRFARPCARGGFCDASGADDGFLPGRCCAASLCRIPAV